MEAMFITLESTEGAGKGSNATFIQDLMAASGQVAMRTREPGGTPSAEQLRFMMLTPNEDYQLSGQDEALMAFAARSNHQRNFIEPCLAKGAHVICERWYDSTMAYQGYGRQLGVEYIESLIRLTHSRTPDLSFLLDIDPEIGMARIRKRTTAERQEHVDMPAMDRIELESMDYFQRCRQGFLQQVKYSNPWRWRVIDASLPLPQVRRQIANVLIEKGLATQAGLDKIKEQYDVA